MIQIQIGANKCNMWVALSARC